MNCKNLKIRTKKRSKYNYCSILKKEITFEQCKSCIHKEYKQYKQLTPKTNISEKHYKKHKLTKATSIPMKVKKEVWKRDNHRCIFCGIEVPLTCANSHVIKRSQLGLGISKNIVCACPICHDKYDFGTNSQEMYNKAVRHLKMIYIDWNKDDVVYKKKLGD